MASKGLELLRRLLIDGLIVMNLLVAIWYRLTNRLEEAIWTMLLAVALLTVRGPE